MPRPKPLSSPAPVARPDAEPLHRSGAVARMLRMPVATLRVWERRYAVCAPQRSPSGQRLYTAAQVQRLALLKQLVDSGHAIGPLAALGMRALQALARTHAALISPGAAAAQASAAATPAPPPRWRPEALADLAALSSTVACECPRHLAELLLRLGQFEAYSAECAHRSPADAALHADLGQVAGQARWLLEQALERVARQEGLLLA